jgi:hypothetical protein
MNDMQSCQQSKCYMNYADGFDLELDAMVLFYCLNL